MELKELISQNIAPTATFGTMVLGIVVVGHQKSQKVLHLDLAVLVQVQNHQHLFQFGLARLGQLGRINMSLSSDSVILESWHWKKPPDLVFRIFSTFSVESAYVDDSGEHPNILESMFARLLTLSLLCYYM